MIQESEDRVSHVRVAVVQDTPCAFDRAGTLTKVGQLTAAAAEQGAQLVVLPEAFVSGYPKGLDFGARVGMRSPEGREVFRRYYDSAVDVPGPDTATLGSIARQHGVYVVIGVIERAGGTLYCTVLFFAPDGALLGLHRKVMPTAMERLIWGFGDGATLPVFATPLGRIGAVICWENYMPALRMAMYQQRVTIYCAPTADDRDTWASTMTHIALEGRCFVLSACQHLRRAQFPDAQMRNALPDSADGVLMRGGSLIVDPLGRTLAGPVFNEDALLTAELDLDLIPQAQMDFDAVGHYARPDVFSLRVNTAPQPAVTLGDGA